MKPHQARLEIRYDADGLESGTKNIMKANEDNSSSNDAYYTVVKGDCLWRIAKQFYGNGAREIEIYNANRETIEATARAHGKPNSYKGESKGWWIWPGEKLIIPGVSGTQTQSQKTKATAEKTGIVSADLGAKIAEQATAFSYTDVASGQSDSVSITLYNIEKEWMGSLMPKRGAALGAKIILTNWVSNEKENTFDCGTFVLDDISFSGRPLSCVFSGVSVPAMDDFKSLPVTKTWEKTTVRDIATQIATKTSTVLHYDADAIQIAEIEQNKQTDSAFLYSLCEKYGLAMKVYNHKIVIFDIVKYEEKEAILTIKETDVNSWSFNTTIEGTYTGVNLNYTNPDIEDTIKISMGNPGRMYAINTQASSRYDAELQAAAKVNAANRGIQTMEITIRANPKIVASCCVIISGFGNLDGKYYVDKVKHSLGNGYTMQLSLHKVQAAIRTAGAAGTSSATGTSGARYYTVVKGDCLWRIAKQFYGNGAREIEIYNANRETIEATARAHGKPNSYKGESKGWWIWPGEKLIIP